MGKGWVYQISSAPVYLCLLSQRCILSTNVISLCVAVNVEALLNDAEPSCQPGCRAGRKRIHLWFGSCFCPLLCLLVLVITPFRLSPRQFDSESLSWGQFRWATQETMECHSSVGSHQLLGQILSAFFTHPPWDWFLAYLCKQSHDSHSGGHWR